MMEGSPRAAFFMPGKLLRSRVIDDEKGRSSLMVGSRMKK
jgi:hypothetical protein